MGGGIAVESAINFCMANTTEDPIIVEDTSSIISDVLKTRGWESVQYTQQVEATGPWDAIRAAADWCSTTYMLVTFCDNVYPISKSIPLYEYATTRLFLSSKPQLDYWNGYCWMKRDFHAFPGGKNVFAGFVVLKTESVLGFPGRAMSLIDIFNHLRLVPREWCEPGWHDIGTVSSYKEYLQCA